jgi:hypothetical protein
MIKGTQACKRRPNLRKRMDLVFLKFFKNRASKMKMFLLKKTQLFQIINFPKKQLITTIKTNKYSITIKIKTVIFKVLKKMIH